MSTADVSQKAVFLTAHRPSARVTESWLPAAFWSFWFEDIVRSFRWWFAIGALLTLSVLMVQGGVRELLDGSLPGSGTSAYLSFATTIFGGGLLAGCVALVMKRLQ